MDAVGSLWPYPVSIYKPPHCSDKTRPVNLWSTSRGCRTVNSHAQLNSVARPRFPSTTLTSRLHRLENKKSQTRNRANRFKSLKCRYCTEERTDHETGLSNSLMMVYIINLKAFTRGRTDHFDNIFTLCHCVNFWRMTLAFEFDIDSFKVKQLANF